MVDKLLQLTSMFCVKQCLLRRMRLFGSQWSLLAASLVLSANVLLNNNFCFAQDLYAYRGGRGSITFTSQKPEGKNYWIVRPRQPSYSYFEKGNGVFRFQTPKPVSSKYDGLILQLARNYQLEPAVIKAVVHVESAFNPNARSPKGAMGLMQLMPGTAERFGVDDAFHPVKNVVGGVRYLRWLFEHFNGNMVYVLAGYNAGEGSVEQYNGIPPYAETKDYVKRVLKMIDYYRCDYFGQKKCYSS